jgi:acetyl-CoA carboxylase carboxyltransferase component
VAAPPGDPGLLVPHAARKTYDMRAVIRSVSDGGEFLEMQPRWGRNMVTGFCRIEGQPVGVVANQPRYLGGVIDSIASEKAARFVRTCNSFKLPLVVLVDTPGFMPGSREETAGVIGHGAQLVRAFAGARTPRVTVILRKAFGGAFITMNSKDLGADASFCWPDAEIGIMSAHAAVEIIHGRRLLGRRGTDLLERLARHYAKESLTPAAAIARGAVDAIIEPAETRERALRALRLAPAESGAHEMLAEGPATRRPRRDVRLTAGHRLSIAQEGAQS